MCKEDIYSKIPLGLARSALFGTSMAAKSERVEIHLEDTSLAVQKLRATKVSYTGPVLNQHHSLLWQSIISAYIEQKTDSIEISGNELLRRMGNKSTCSQMHSRLIKMLRDLRSGEISYQTATHDYMGGLVSGVKIARVNVGTRVRKGNITITINNELSKLFDDEVLVNDLTRKVALGNNQLALWLHDFIATHKVVPPISLLELKRLARSGFELKKFKFEVKKALVVLSSPECGLVTGFSINKHNVLSVSKNRTNVVILDQFRAAKASGDGMDASASSENKGPALARQQRAMRAKVAL